MQNVLLFQTLCAHVGGPKNYGDAGTTPPWNGGVTDPLETRFSITYVTMPNIVAVITKPCKCIFCQF